MDVGSLYDVQIAADMNDAQLIMNKLSVCHSDSDILQVFSSVHGPWAFVFWQVGVTDILDIAVLFKRIDISKRITLHISVHII